MTKTSNIYYPINKIEKTFINYIWRLSDFDLHSRKELILPKGTVEIIFNFSDKIIYFNPSLQTKKELPTVFINGINFKPFELIKTGRQEFLGVQLNVIGLRLLFNISPKELNNVVCNGNNICSQLENIANELFLKKEFGQQVQIILQWINERLYPHRMEDSISRAQKLMNCSHEEDLTVKKISHEICISDRQLRRFSQDWLGMNTEEFILYSKYLNSLHLLGHSKENLTEIGLRAGYYDQSHFIREFRSYTNMTPGQYRDAHILYPGHILLEG